MADPIRFIANLPPVQSALTMSGDGQRCLIKLEAFNTDAAIANIGLQQFSNRSFVVTIEEVTKDLTKLDDREETERSGQEPERRVTRVGRRRS